MGVTQLGLGIDSCPVSVTGAAARMVCGDRKIWGVGARVGGGWVVGRIGLPSGYEPLVNWAVTLVFAGSGNGGNGIAKHLRGSSRAERGVLWGGRGVELRRGARGYDALRQTENSAIALLDGAVAIRAGGWLGRSGVPKNKKMAGPAATR
jgi:hypothetical protein